MDRGHHEFGEGEGEDMVSVGIVEGEGEYEDSLGVMSRSDIDLDSQPDYNLHGVSVPASGRYVKRFNGRRSMPSRGEPPGKENQCNRARQRKPHEVRVSCEELYSVKILDLIVINDGMSVDSEGWRLRPPALQALDNIPRIC